MKRLIYHKYGKYLKTRDAMLLGHNVIFVRIDTENLVYEIMTTDDTLIASKSFNSLQSCKVAVRKNLLDLGVALESEIRIVNQ